ncbi:Cuticular protein RR1 motif 44 [Caligus rogercresseyi]|uniref:Cuticular protein RR1 motif 44 n=1 Tax=Caligus rogercresseyi TaxID=217165 RepID=A0A7T8KFS0_CALRO|nr:Cuticular protein RR1 motif 44 [Caligus rogercresseyi]
MDPESTFHSSRLIRKMNHPPGTLDGSSNFDFSFASDNGISQEAFGSTKIIDGVEVVVMRGSYSYMGPDGLVYTVDWTADETGYHPSAAHLPKEVLIPFPSVFQGVQSQKDFADKENRFKGNNYVFPVTNYI